MKGYGKCYDLRWAGPNSNVRVFNQKHELVAIQSPQGKTIKIAKRGNGAKKH